MKIIVNADDCGINSHVNQHIKNSIECGNLTSTTIMSNMEDLEGAFALYEQYNKSISFGVHLNLTEGEPLIKSKILLDAGFYKEQDGMVFFNSEMAESFRYKFMPRTIAAEVYRELCAQIDKVQKGGVKISHFDSHHHIHTCLGLMGVMSQLSKDYEVYKIRRIRNYFPRSLNFYGRQLWAIMSKCRNRRIIMTDYFAIFQEYAEHSTLVKIKNTDVLELMVHPGGIYLEEEDLFMRTDLSKVGDLINYNQL